MAGWLEFNDVPVRIPDEICRGNCDCRDGYAVPADMFHQVVQVLLRRLYAKNAIKPIPVSLGYSQSVDLFKLFCFVREKGGFESVSRGNLWGLVAKKMDLDFRVIASLKMIYFNKLADLDQWLDSIGKDWSSTKLSDGWGRNLNLLSTELEKRIRLLYSVDGKVVNIEKDDIRPRVDQIYDHRKVAIKENLQIPMVKENTEFLGNGNIANSKVAEKIRENEPDTNAERPDPDTVESQCTRKRKRDSDKMLSWLRKIAKNPFQLSKMGMLDCCKWKGNGVKEYLPFALLVRVAMLKKKYPNSGIKCCSHKKQKIHPSMYDDPATCRLPGIRLSKSLLKSSICPGCILRATKQGIMDKNSAAVDPENGAEQKDEKTPDSPGSSSSELTDGSSPDKHPVQKCVRVGRQHQAEIPTLTGESSSKWLGSRVWLPNRLDCETVTTMPLVLGKGRPDTCDCMCPGTVECVRFHTMENNMRLKRELGRAFYQWKLDRAGETVSLSWAPQEEEDFKSVMCTTPLSMGESYFPKKTRQEMIDYYFNVFLQRRRIYQNRVTPNAIDSDDELSDFGSVGGLYGHVAIHTTGTNPGICSQNEQYFDIGLNCEG